MRILRARFGSELSAATETLSHVLRLQQSFKAFDSDNDGSISLAELDGLMGSLGYYLSDQEVRAMMQRGDKNRDGLLTMDEFLDMSTKESQLGSLVTQMGNVLGALDIEGNDILTGEVMFEALNNIEVELMLQDCQHLITYVDGDGDVSFEDFKNIINSILH